MDRRIERERERAEIEGQEYHAQPGAQFNWEKILVKIMTKIVMKVKFENEICM